MGELSFDQSCSTHAFSAYLRGSVPSFIHASDGKLHDVHALNVLFPNPDAFDFTYRGCVDFRRLYALHQAGAFQLTRAKSNVHAHPVYSATDDPEAGVICGQTIAMGGYRTQQHYPVDLQRILF